MSKVIPAFLGYASLRSVISPENLRYSQMQNQNQSHLCHSGFARFTQVIRFYSAFSLAPCDIFPSFFICFTILNRKALYRSVVFTVVLFLLCT